MIYNKCHCVINVQIKNKNNIKMFIEAKDKHSYGYIVIGHYN